MRYEMEMDGETRQVCLQIWDTAGQERFQALGVSFYRGADCCVLVYDITDGRSFDHLPNWQKQFLHHCAPEEPKSFPFLVVGNKSDDEEKREVKLARA